MKIIMGRNAYAIESQPVTTYWRKEGPVSYQTSNTKTYAIVNGCVAAVLLVALIVFVYLWLTQRKHSSYEAVTDSAIAGDKV